MQTTPRSAVSALHLPGLDGLRGLAIVLVLVHSLTLFAHPVSAGGQLYHAALAFGWSGVQLFFVLSGFLITGILVDTRPTPHYFRNFYIRRALRIFPLYYVTLAVAFIVLPALDRMPQVYAGDYPHQAFLWLYLSNWRHDIGGGFSHYWSLALEEQFYLVWPLVVFFCSRPTLLKICIGLSVAGVLTRGWMRAHGMPDEVVYVSTPARADALTSGAAMALLIRQVAVRDWLRGHLGALGVATAGTGMLALLLTGPYGVSVTGQVFGYCALAWFFSLVVLGSALLDLERMPLVWRGVLAWKPLRVLGKYSYGMYIFQRQIHVFIGLAFVKPWASASLGIDVLYVGLASMLTLAMAIASYHLFERPLLRLKYRFTNSEVDVPGSAQPGGPPLST